MKTRPFIISAIAILAASLLFLRCKSSKVTVDNDDLSRFLQTFNKYVLAGEKDSLGMCFTSNHKNPGLEKLINALIDQKTTDGENLELTLIIDDALILNSNTNTTTAKIPVLLAFANLPTQSTTITLGIAKTGAKQYKITEVDGRRFFTQLIAFQNFIKSNTLSDKDIYSPITLKAFATADQIKAKYDSVVWFAHIKQQTYFYVVKGKWNMYQSLIEHSQPCKMGLVGPDQNEIIPAEYDLIHNIGDVFDNMVEVEQGGKKGFIDLSGKVVVPVAYDNIFLINDDNNLAALKQGADFYWLKNDFTISEKVDVKIADILPRLKQARSISIADFGSADNVTEFNSREEHGSIYIPPSYLVDMNLLPVTKCFKNPIRKKVEYYDASTSYTARLEPGQNNDDNWFQSAFYSIRDYFLGGRAEFYDKKNLLIVDKKSNNLFAADIEFSYGEYEGSGSVSGECDVNNVKALNDSLFEVKSGASLYASLYDTTQYISGATHYHYFVVRNNKLVKLSDRRIFGFTKHVKMTDAYLSDCYDIVTMNGQSDSKSKIINRLNSEMLRYMKNEIYADYRYQFKDKRWREIFANLTGDYDNDYNGKVAPNANVDDSLTVIDKYNINFIDKKLKAMKPVSLAAK